MQAPDWAQKVLCIIVPNRLHPAFSPNPNDFPWVSEDGRHAEIQCTCKCNIILVFCTSGSQVHSFQHPKHQPGYGIEDPSILHGPETMKIDSAGLSLRGGGRGFPPATMNKTPGYFQRKIKEK